MYLACDAAWYGAGCKFQCGHCLGENNCQYFFKYGLNKCYLFNFCFIIVASLYAFHLQNLIFS